MLLLPAMLDAALLADDPRIQGTGRASSGLGSARRGHDDNHHP
jgi:hypothetical protein